MLKSLVIATVSLAFLFANGPNKQAAKHEEGTSNIPAPPVTIVDNSVRQNDQNRSGREAPESHAGIEWSNWALVLIAGATGWAVWKQAKESANATKAMRESIELQEVQFRQWVEIGDWENATGYLQPTVKQALIVVRCKVGNTTKFPLTLKAITIGRNGKSDTFNPNILIPPNEGHPTDIPVDIEIADLQEYWRNGYKFGVSIDLVYEDVLRRDRSQHFLHMVYCGPTRCDATELRNQAQSQAIYPP